MKLQKNTSLLVLCCLSVSRALAAGPVVDSVRMGDAASEQAHAVAGERSETVTELAGQTGRRLLPLDTPTWEGGRVAFKLKVDPEKPNYVTAKFSGSETSEDRLILYCEGKQIGYRHLGDIDILDFGSEGNGAPYPGRFYYNTTPIPEDMSKGKTELSFEIRSSGRMWGYGTTFEQYQKTMDKPTRAIYNIYAHTEGYFDPPAGEAQGSAPATPGVRPAPGAEVLDAVKERINRELKKQLESTKPLTQLQIHLLARATHVKWSLAYNNPQAVKKIVEACDDLYARYAKDPNIARKGDPQVYNADWFGTGLAGDAIRLVAPSLEPFLDEPVAGVEGVTRRAGWSAMLQDSRDWHRRNRRLYTNQTMINDLNVYRANKGVAAIDAPHAMSDEQILRYLYESIGLIAWTDSDPGGELPAETGRKPWNAGPNYMQLTAKGLSKELGYVGYYGEVIDWVTQIYDATRVPGEEGNPKIKAQLEKIANARAVFRYPAVDGDGFRAMRIESIVGWRDAHYPGDVVYGERPSWDATALYAAAATLDDGGVSYAKQMLEDNQFFSSLERAMKDANNLRVTSGLLGAPDQYEAIAKHPDPGKRLPMTAGQPDFVFSDEEDGVVAVKNGEDIFYASVYWRARNAINFLARVHYMTPLFDRVAVVREKTEFTPSGMTFTRPNWTNMGFGNGGIKYPGDLQSAHAGEQQPIAFIPPGVDFKPGNENINAGRGDFYTLDYGPYRIGLNMSAGKTFTLEAPDVVSTNLESKQQVQPGEKIRVPARTTVVLYSKPVEP